ncbi:MAG: DNA starvation/stationary phase protection protein Dps [Acidobacteria bacterium]|nr:DNA starvation/stationary phase protection protein Dps [Acidobacteriota bacterium]
MATQTASSALHPTKNTLDPGIRQAVADLLNARLADAIDLQLQSKQAHWNVKGPNFIGLHELFDQVAEAVQKYVDELAERAVMLGGVAVGTSQAVAGRTTLAPYPVEAQDWSSHVECLSAALAHFGDRIREGIEQSETAGDPVTADLLTGISHDVDKFTWFVEAHQA